MIITVCENSKIPCSIVQRKALQAFDAQYRGRSSKSRIFDWRHKEVWAKNYVGVIQVPGLTLEILPKIDRSTIDSSDQEKLRAQHNLLYMLSFTKKLPFEERDLTSLKLQEMPLLEILIRLFVTRMMQELRRGIDRAYVHREDNLPCVKGKILMTQHLLVNAAHRESFYVGFDEFLDDTPLNRILKATSRRLLSVSITAETQRLLMETVAIFDEVGDIIPDAHHFDRVHLHRNNERFLPLLDFCRMVWQEKSPNPSAGDSRTFSILFPMEQLFEEFIARFIRRHASDFGFRREDVCIQSVGNSRCLVREETSQSQKFKLQPDLLVKSGKRIGLILDTKWKHLKADEEDAKNAVPQADMYQMYAYAHRYDCNEVILLYPDIGKVSPKSYRLLGDEERRIRVAVININRNLKKEYHEFCREMSNILCLEPI
jgi:5-methylcytosine-specific restriction enzyme subunit McrC